MSKMLQRVVGAVGAVLVLGVLTFGATQAFASTGSAAARFCVGTCPPLTPGVFGTCWFACAAVPGYVGGDCGPSGQCCCFS